LYFSNQRNLEFWKRFQSWIWDRPLRVVQAGHRLNGPRPSASVKRAPRVRARTRGHRYDRRPSRQLVPAGPKPCAAPSFRPHVRTLLILCTPAVAMLPPLLVLSSPQSALPGTISQVSKATSSWRHCLPRAASSSTTATSFGPLLVKSPSTARSPRGWRRISSSTSGTPPPTDRPVRGSTSPSQPREL
jgi:hypothetical protein